MNWSRYKRDLRVNAIGHRWWITVTGILVTALFTLGSLVAFIVGVDVGNWWLASAPSGGFVAGAMRGTNVYDGAKDGLRASFLGIGLVAVVLGLALALYLFQLTGDVLPFWPQWVALVTFVGFAPFFLFLGILAGVTGVLLRRIVIHRKYNPPAYGSRYSAGRKSLEIFTGPPL